MYIDPSAPPRKSVPKPKQNIQQPPAPPPPVSKPAKKKSSKNQMEEYQKAALAFEAKNNMKNAWAIYEQILDSKPDTTFALEGIGRIAYGAGKYDIASDVLQRLVALDATSHEAATQLGHVMLDNGQYPQALECFKVALNNATVRKCGQETTDNLKVQIARVLYRSDDQDSAISILNSVLGEEMAHQGALLEYGIACMDRDKPDDALKIFLRLLVGKPDDKVLRSRLAQAVRQGGVDTVTQEIDPGTEASAPALAFLGLIVKDYSAIDEAVALYRMALGLAPANMSYALNLVHTLEVKCQYQEAMQALREFCEANPELKCGSLTCRKFLDASPAAFSALEGDSSDSSESPGVDNASGKPLHERTRELCPDLCKTGSEMMVTKGKPKPPYADKELDLLALFYTAVKILFVSGHPEHILDLAAVLEPIRGNYELHLTTIRNENAYYCCVIQLLTCPGISRPSGPAPIYVVGDSHSLAPSWRSITVGGEERALLGRLVTGLKMWHLRPESEFFPKANFEAAIANVPDGSDALFVFGEIDCREGLVVCVDKCRYDDIEEGAEVTIKIYLERLVKIVKAKGLRIFVHPVNPVIKETRYIVKTFNRVLKKMVTKYAASLQGELAGKLVWLDFFTELLTEDGTTLRDEYNLDGTHVHPAYLGVLERAMNASLE